MITPGVHEDRVLRELWNGLAIHLPVSYLDLYVLNSRLMPDLSHPGQQPITVWSIDSPTFSEADVLTAYLGGGTFNRNNPYVNFTGISPNELAVRRALYRHAEPGTNSLPANKRFYYSVNGNFYHPTDDGFALALPPSVYGSPDYVVIRNLEGPSNPFGLSTVPPFGWGYQDTMVTQAWRALHEGGYMIITFPLAQVGAPDNYLTWGLDYVQQLSGAHVIYAGANQGKTLKVPGTQINQNIEDSYFLILEKPRTRWAQPPQPPQGTWLRSGRNFLWGPVSDAPPPKRRDPDLSFVPGQDQSGNANTYFGSVLFGGRSKTQVNGQESDVFFDDLWSWVGFGWLSIPSSGGPPARSGASMVFDLHRNKLVLYGGTNGRFDNPRKCAELSDTWEWDPHTGKWSEVFAESLPGPLEGQQMVFDSNRNAVILFGGQKSCDGQGSYMGATWAYEGMAWTPLAGPLIPCAYGQCDLSRTTPSLSYDSATGSLVLLHGYAGADTGCVTDQWDMYSMSLESIDGGTALPVSKPQWTFYEETSGVFQEEPGSHTMVYDPYRDRLIEWGAVGFSDGLCCGAGCITPQTREWDGQPAYHLNPTNSGDPDWQVFFQKVYGIGGDAAEPPARTGQGMTFDADRGVTVMFGGQGLADQAFLGDLWEYGGAPADDSQEAVIFACGAGIAACTTAQPDGGSTTTGTGTTSGGGGTSGGAGTSGGGTVSGGATGGNGSGGNGGGQCPPAAGECSTVGEFCGSGCDCCQGQCVVGMCCISPGGGCDIYGKNLCCSGETCVKGTCEGSPGGGTTSGGTGSGGGGGAAGGGGTGSGGSGAGGGPTTGGNGTPGTGGGTGTGGVNGGSGGTSGRGTGSTGTGTTGTGSGGLPDAGVLGSTSGGTTGTGTSGTGGKATGTSTGTGSTGSTTGGLHAADAGHIGKLTGQ